ncbi:MAG: class I SAM-dependent methyltransferase [Chloroflexota bacterium]
MKTSKYLTDPLYWDLTPLAHERAQRGMDSRANLEIQEIAQGLDVKQAHGQAARDYPQFEQLIRGAFIFLKKIGYPVGGWAVDMGSGTGVGACILSKYDTIEKVFAVEFSAGFVHHVMPIVFDKFGADFSKIQRVVGDFNNLQLEDNSVGVILDIDSFHHSEDLDYTLRECYRAICWGGVVISIDRAWPDSYTQEQLDAMLDRELNDNLKCKYGISAGMSFTRRDFGEHEYTVGQWIRAYERSGFFNVAAFSQWHPPGLNRIWLRLPTFEASVILDSLLYRFGFRRFVIYGFAKTRTLFVSIKR